MATNGDVRKAERAATVKETERCEAMSYVSSYITHRCTHRGELYHVAGGIAVGFARLCGTHRNTFDRAGFTLQSLTPLEAQARKAAAS